MTAFRGFAMHDGYIALPMDEWMAAAVYKMQGKRGKKKEERERKESLGRLRTKRNARTHTHAVHARAKEPASERTERE